MTESGVGRALLCLLVVLLLCSVAITPILRGASPCTHDGGLHYYRVAAMRHAFGQGVLYSRWLPDLAFGYGFPFFNYRAPLSYYLTLGLHLAGLPLPWSHNLVYVLSLLGSAVGAYLLARDLFGLRAGILVGVAYAYAPYQLLDTLVRGNQPEAVALALLPWILWAFRRLALTNRRRWFVVSVGLLTALYVGHNISSLLFTPFLLAYLVMLWCVYRRQGHWSRVASAFLLALGLSAFFWLPALAEKEYVQLYLTTATRNNDFRNNFQGLSQIFALPQPQDTSLMNPPLRVRLGVVQPVLAGAGLVLGLAVVWKHGRRREPPGPQEDGHSRGCGSVTEGPGVQWVSWLFFAGIAALCVFMATPSSMWFWEHVPLLSFVQFPWRLVGRASLPVALLAGAPLLLLEGTTPGLCRSSRWGRRALGPLLPILIVVVVLAVLPSTYAPHGYCPMEPYPTIQDVHRYEHTSGLVGVDPVGAYFPKWVQQRPTGTRLEAQYADEQDVARFDVSLLPHGSHILTADYGPNRARIVIESSKPFRARYQVFYFPGWKVWVDGKRVDVSPSAPGGLLTFEVPAGRHTIRVRFGETPLRLVADVISALALLGLIVSTVRSPGAGAYPPVSGAGSETGHSMVIALLLTGALLVILKLGIVDRVRTPFRRPRLQPDGTLREVEHPMHQSYAGGLDLIGYDQSTGEMSADGTLRLDLYWTVRERPSRRYQSVIHLIGPDGVRWSGKDGLRPPDSKGPPPTTTWAPDRYVLDSHEIEPLPGTPPGRYDVVLTVFDRETLAPLSVLDELGQPTAPESVLGNVALTAPRRHPGSSDLDIGNRLDARLGPLTLLGAGFDRDEAAPGDPILMTGFWRTEERPIDDLTMRLELRAAGDSAAGEYDLSPAAPWYPTGLWQPGDVWRGHHLLHLPADVDTATYTWTLSLASSPSLPLSELSVTAPDRTFTGPPLDVETRARLDEVATLLGANVEPGTANLEPGSTLTITLVWRAEAETDTSYRVFLHLIGPDGLLMSQSDGVPVDWTRPTTGWLMGEVITDVREVQISSDASAGVYAIYAGMYASGGGRLSTPEGVDAVPVAMVSVTED